MKHDFGNIENTSLADVVDTLSFTKFWGINKDKINICQLCEFRYVCTDCRAYLDDPEDIFSKPLKCGYNPSTNVWERDTINFEGYQLESSLS